jgi:hypothetical protein
MPKFDIVLARYKWRTGADYPGPDVASTSADACGRFDRAEHAEAAKKRFPGTFMTKVTLSADFLMVFEV